MGGKGYGIELYPRMRFERLSGWMLVMVLSLA